MVDVRKGDIIELFNSPNMLTLYKEYSKESKNTLTPEIDPCEEMYVGMENLGMLDFVGAYDGDKLVGFIVALTTTMAHYSLAATTVESFFVIEKYRKYGTAKRLLKEIESIAKEKGAVNVFMSSPIHSALHLAARAMGYTNTHIIHTKKLV